MDSDIPYLVNVPYCSVLSSVIDVPFLASHYLVLPFLSECFRVSKSIQQSVPLKNSVRTGFKTALDMI